MTIHDDRNALATLAFSGSASAASSTLFVFELKQQAQLHAASFVECRYYGNDVYLCVCLEAAPQEDRTLTWWMDITPREGMWLIESLRAVERAHARGAGCRRSAFTIFKPCRAEVPGILEQLLQAGAAVLDKIIAQQDI